MTGIRPLLRLVLCVLTALTALAALAPAASLAADQTYSISIDGRRVDGRSPSGRSRNGVMYINLIRAVRTFDGLLTFAPGGVAHVTLSGQTVDFRVGSRTARAGQTRLRLPGAPFVLQGDEYVPLATVATLVSAKLRIDAEHHRAILTTAAATN